MVILESRFLLLNYLEWGSRSTMVARNIEVVRTEIRYSIQSVRNIRREKNVLKIEFWTHNQIPGFSKMFLILIRKRKNRETDFLSENKGQYFKLTRKV